MGYQTAEDSGVRLLTEAAEIFLERLCRSLRLEQDADLERNHDSTGWTDIVEKVGARKGATRTGKLWRDGSIIHK